MFFKKDLPQNDENVNNVLHANGNFHHKKENIFIANSNPNTVFVEHTKNPFTL